MRLPIQRGRLLQAAAEEFARLGYAQASSESISRRAGMSKATFYEHFANKEGCMIALFDTAADVVVQAMVKAAERAGSDPKERLKQAIRAFLTTLSEHPEFAQTLLVEIFGAGPNAARRRDESMQQYAELLDAENAAAAERGLIERFRSPHDPIAIVGAINELVSRQVRLGEPKDVLELAPVIDRVIAGLLAPANS
ncbi:MAG: TetR/AcrR family transcriptional regulator [Actinomycetota bacterium]|nr:TetR/AcrR family transcriptional regulator [Actinomycetota bacterium]